MEKSGDGGGTWEGIGASVWRRDPQNADGTVELYPELAAEGAGGWGSMEVDYRPGWQWSVSAVRVRLCGRGFLIARSCIS